MADEYADVFTCIECRNPRVAIESRVKNDFALISGKCLKGHNFDLKLPMDQEHKWIGHLRNSIYKCRCGMPLEDVKIKDGEKETQLTLKCTKHTQERKVDTVLWLTISTDKETQKTLQKEQELELDSYINSVQSKKLVKEKPGKKDGDSAPRKWPEYI
jgi:S-adenosylmethionine synthetase